MSHAFSCRVGVVCAWALLLPWASALDPTHDIGQSVHRIWQNQPGLRQSTINVVTQSSDGYLWLGTPSGVVRFDGARFTSVPALEQASLGDFWARTIVEDSARRVWMVSNTDFRLVRIGDDGVKVFAGDDSQPLNEASCVASGRGGEIWVCTPGGLARFQDGRWRVYQNGPKSRQIAACEAYDNTVWMAGGSTITSWDGSAFTTHKLRSVPADTTMRALLCATDGSLWVGTRNGLVQLKDGEEHLYSFLSGLPDNVINSLAEGRGGNLWIGTSNGLSRFHDGVFDSYGYREGLSQSTVFSLFEDREGSLWVATKHGLNQFMDGAATRFTKNEGLPSDNVGPLLQDHRGKLWAGTLEGGLARFDGVHFIPITHFSNNRITTLAETTDGALWAGTDRGLIRLEDGQTRETYTTEQGLPSNRIRSLFRDHSGALWAGTERGPAKLDRGGFVQEPGFGRIRHLPIVAMGETPDGQMLFAAERGSVYLFSSGTLQELMDGDTPVRDVDAFYTDPEGLVWMGATANGLRMWRDGKISRFQVRDGLYDGEIYGVLPDRQGHLWMSCSKGFFSVSRSELLDFAAGKIPKVTSSPFSPLDGLRTIQGMQGIQPVGAAASNGQLWFSSTYGVLAFGPHVGVRDVPPPPVVIEEVSVNGETVALNRIHNLAPGQKNLEFDYTAPTFLTADRTTFRYILEGYDQNWTDAGTRREAFYTNLPPGKFRFRVTACTLFVPCNEAGAAIEFELLPNFYQRVWFLPLCAIVLGMLGWLAYQFRIRQLREQFGLVLAERSRIARELHDTLIQGFSGITMQMQALVGRVRSPEEKLSLNEIIKDAGECLRETRRSVAGLRASSGASPGLAIAIADAARQITQERNIRLKLNLDETQPELPAEVKYNLLCIAQEAVANSVKHSGARTIEIGLICSRRDLRLSVRDDGRGMPRDGNPSGQTGHYGLIGMKERASQIGAEFELVSAPGRGTTISVQVPVTREAYIASSQERQEASR
jgi:signal transduction histidine kinase/ligand-binding sensor domain-containing protein